MTDNHTQPSQQVPVAIIDHCWDMYKLGQVSADHTAKEVFAGVLQSFNDWLLAQSAPDAGLAEDAKRWRYAASRLSVICWTGNGYEFKFWLPAKREDTNPSKMIDAALASQEPQHG